MTNVVRTAVAGHVVVLAASIRTTSPTDTSSNSVADPAAGQCTQGDVQYFADAHTLFVQNSTFVNDVAATYDECQFRFYDDNDSRPDNPEVPHVFTDRDYVLGGLFLFESYRTKNRPDYTRSEATQSLDDVTIHVFFGPATTPGADLPELRLTHARGELNRRNTALNQAQIAVPA